MTTIPLTAKSIGPAMDPSDVIEYEIEFGGDDGLLEVGEQVASYTIVLSAEAVALGLELGTSTRAPSQPTPTSLRLWFQVNASFRSNAAYSGAGTVFSMEATIVTDATPSRTRQRTLLLTVAQL